MAYADMFKDAAAQVATSAQATAAQGSFDESKGTAGRVQSITSQGSPLMTAARTRAKQTMTRMGTQNSSLAGQAGEQAVIETATPIAAQDASLYQQQQLANQQAQNQVNMANANANLQAGLAGMQLGEGARQFDTSLGWDKEKFGGTLMEQRRQFDASLGMQDRQLTQQNQQFQANFGLDTKRLEQDAQQFGQRIQLERDNLTAQREQFAQRLGLDVQQLELNRNQLSQQDRQFLAELDQKQQQLAQQESQFTRDQQSRVTLANLDATNRERLMQIEAGYKQDIAGNENISRAWGSMMDSITQIQNNPELDQGAKSTMIQNAQNSFAAFANFWKKQTGGNTDVSDLLNFGQTGGGTGGGGTGGGQSGTPDSYGLMPEGWTPSPAEVRNEEYYQDPETGRWRKREP